MSQQVATGWPNVRKMLRPTILGYVAFKCCDRLAGAFKCWPMLLPFPNLTVSQLVEVKQLCIEQFYYFAISKGGGCFYPPQPVPWIRLYLKKIPPVNLARSKG